MIQIMKIVSRGRKCDVCGKEIPDRAEMYLYANDEQLFFLCEEDGRYFVEEVREGFEKIKMNAEILGGYDEVGEK